MRHSIIAISAILAIVSIASAAEKVANPAYKAWAQFKVGSWSKVKGETKIKMNDAEQTSTMSITRKLVEFTPEKAVVETTMTMNMAGQEQAMPAQKQEIPATIDADKVDQAIFQGNEGANITDVKQGDEEITVLGKKVKCHYYQATISQGGQGGPSMQAKVWTSTDIPGGMVQLEGKSDMMNMAMKLDSQEVAK